MAVENAQVVRAQWTCRLTGNWSRHTGSAHASLRVRLSCKVRHAEGDEACPVSDLNQPQSLDSINVAFDFRSDAGGRDPDTYSPTLRHYHKLLWSKPLPRGEHFELSIRGNYLHYKPGPDALILSSDAVVPTFRWVKQISNLTSESDLKELSDIGCTIGGMMIFPAVQIDRQWTVNQARGCDRRIRDRFDLTLECIRRYYAGLSSPLSEVLTRYGAFFELFGDFRGYVEFFLLQDLASDDLAAVRISHPFDDFRGSPIPANAQEYETYRRASIDFINARNRRIRRYCATCVA